MNREPPEGSAIRVDRDIRTTVYSWDNGKTSILRYLIVIPLLLFLGPWFMGEISAIRSLMKDDMPLFGRLFMIFWLGGWTVGGIMIMYSIYNLVKPLKPASLKLSTGAIRYETGTEPFDFFMWDYRRRKEFSSFFKRFRNKVYDVESANIKNLQLERVGERQRLSFDYGVQRLEIGKSLTEPEREWLYDILKEHIGISSK